MEEVFSEGGRTFENFVFGQEEHFDGSFGLIWKKTALVVYCIYAM